MSKAKNHSVSQIKDLVKKNKLLLSCGTGGLTAVVATAATHAVGTAAGYSGGAAILHGSAVVAGAVGGAAAAPVLIGAAAVVATVATVKAIESLEEGGL